MKVDSYLKSLEGFYGEFSYPTISLSYFFHSDFPNLDEIENYPEIVKSDFDDYGEVSKLDLLILGNIELDFKYYGKLL